VSYLPISRLRIQDKYQARVVRFAAEIRPLYQQ
jgi:hypothetical protein